MARRWMFLAVVAAAGSLSAGESVGWRGDGTGLYPKADPPTQWQRVSRSVAALRFQADAPKGDEATGKPMPDGVIRQWLVLGPIENKSIKTEAADALFAEDQSKLSPASGQQAAGAAWKAFDTETNFLDLAKLYDTYGKNVSQVAYAHAYVYSPAEANILLDVNHTMSLHLWVNGKLTHKVKEAELNYVPQAVKLQKGWNRLLLRATPQPLPEKGESRPIGGSWYASVVFQAAPDAEYDQKNIAWRSLMPHVSGCGEPIVVGGKIFLLSDPADLVCVDGATGKILWVRSNNYDELADEAERKTNAEAFAEIASLAKRLKEVNDSFATDAAPKIVPLEGSEGYKEKLDLEKKLYGAMAKVDPKKYVLPKGQDVGYSGMTPVSDGKYVWAWFATGVTCCYDLDGKLVWRRLDNEGSFFEHGYSVSPVLAGGKLIVFMNKMIGFDAAKGERLWTTEFDPKMYWANRFHGTPAVANIGKDAVCILPTRWILRASDGKILRDKGPEIGAGQQEMPSPVTIGNTVYELSTYSNLAKLMLPAEASDPLKIDPPKQVKMNVDRYPTSYLPWHMASPLIYEGLAYCINNAGVLSVIDIEKMEVVYEKQLDLDHFQSAHEGAGRGVAASPAMAGGRIYLVGNTGSTLVIKPGRTYEQLAKNKIECVVGRYWAQRHERFVANPTFDGKRMFLRGERFLYCLEGK